NAFLNLWRLSLAALAAKTGCFFEFCFKTVLLNQRQVRSYSLPEKEDDLHGSIVYLIVVLIL
ncbi:MAG: hypothetical protein ACPGVM_09220, partial [Prochlorococcaceae cyanobacterium]